MRRRRRRSVESCTQHNGRYLHDARYYAGDVSGPDADDFWPHDIWPADVWTPNHRAGDD